MRAAIRVFTTTASALLLAGVLATPASAATYEIFVQPIQVCEDDGTNCANSAMELFFDETNKIWAQADIAVTFLDWMTVNESDQLNETNFGDLGPTAGAVINMWFVESLSDCGGPANPASLFGCGTVGSALGAGFVAITDLVFSFNAGIGRLDTIAHELGHVLGLGHSDFGAGGSENLMSSGSVRGIPSTINDIFPDGADLDQLTAEQIARALESPYVQLSGIPEPATMTLIGVGLAGLYARRRRRG